MGETKMDRLAKAREAAKKKAMEKREQGLPIKRDPIQIAQDNPGSRRYAINAMCWQCQGEGHDPGIKWRIGNCEIGKSCPLYSFRPYQRLLEKPPPSSIA